MTDCETCTRRTTERAVVGRETFTMTLEDPEGHLTWDIDKARALVTACPRAPRALGRPGPNRDYFLQAGEVDEPHLPHIPPDQRGEPGLAVVLDQTLPDGTRQVLVVQIDGSHRAELARRAGARPLVYLLSEAEQAACVLLYVREGRVQPLPMAPGPAPTV